MKFYKLAFLYSAFNQGYSLTSPLKWAAAVFGIGSAIQGYNVFYILLGSIVYFLFCLGTGVLCFKYGWVEAMQEVSNKYNPFAREVREKLKTKRFK